MKKEKLEAIITANEYIDKLMEGIEFASEKIHRNQEEEGITLLPQIIEGLDYIFRIIQLTDNVFGYIKDEKKITPYLIEIIEGMENEDYTLVADIYVYEILPILQEIKLIFVQVIYN